MRKLLSLTSLFLLSVTVGAQTVSWQPAQSVAPSSADNSHPRIALAANGNPVVLWGKMANASVNVSRWTGTAFSAPVRVSPAAVQVFTTSWAGPDIAAKGDTVYAIYKAQPEDTAGIYLVKSTNGGASFGMPVRVDNMLGNYSSRFPTIATDGSGQPLVGFMKFDNPDFARARWVVTKSMNWGNSFMPDTLASSFNNDSVCDCCPGSLVSSATSSVMLYRNNRNNRRTIWAGISTNNSSSFPSGVEVDNTGWMFNSCPSTGPDGVIVGDTLHTAFMSGISGMKVYYSKTKLSTMQAGASVPVTGTSSGIASQNFPRIANDGNAVAIVWPQTENGMPQVAGLFTPDITKGFPMTSVGGPLAWETAVINPMGSGIMNVDVAVKNGTIHIVWEDMASGTVMYRKGTFNTTPAGISPTSVANDLSLFPVPANQEIQLVLAQAESKPCLLTVTDMFGRIVLQENYTSLTNSTIVSTALLVDGTYLLKLATEAGTIAKRFLVIH